MQRSTSYLGRAKRESSSAATPAAFLRSKSPIREEPIKHSTREDRAKSPVREERAKSPVREERILSGPGRAKSPTRATSPSRATSPVRALSPPPAPRFCFDGFHWQVKINPKTGKSYLTISSPGSEISAATSSLSVVSTPTSPSSTVSPSNLSVLSSTDKMSPLALHTSSKLALPAAAERRESEAVPDEIPPPPPEDDEPFVPAEKKIQQPPQPQQPQQQSDVLTDAPPPPARTSQSIQPEEKDPDRAPPPPPPRPHLNPLHTTTAAATTTNLTTISVSTDSTNPSTTTTSETSTATTTTTTSETSLIAANNNPRDSLNPGTSAFRFDSPTRASSDTHTISVSPADDGAPPSPRRAPSKPAPMRRKPSTDVRTMPANLGGWVEVPDCVKCGAAVIAGFPRCAEHEKQRMAVLERIVQKAEGLPPRKEAPTRDAYKNRKSMTQTPIVGR